MVTIISRGKKNGRPSAQVVLKREGYSRTVHLVWDYRFNGFTDSGGAIWTDVPYPKSS